MSSMTTKPMSSAVTVCACLAHSLSAKLVRVVSMSTISNGGSDSLTCHTAMTAATVMD
jgi:hypothetical protein